MQNKIYLDNNASTAVDPFVIEAVLRELAAGPGNPSSVHSFGRAAKIRLQEYREQVAHFLRVAPRDILFTSGGTEGLQLLIRGFFSGGHIVSSSVEHASVYHTLRALEAKGAALTLLPAGLKGAVEPQEVEAELREETKLLVFSAVNPETGVKHNIPALAKIASKRNIPFVVDGVSWMGKELFSLPEGVSGIAFSGHKFHAPQGVGFIYLAEGHPFTPALLGAHQEYGLRGGTENMPGIAGLAAAINLLPKHLPAATERMAQLRDHLERRLLSEASPSQVNGTGPRICNVSNLSFPPDLGEELLIGLDERGIAVSHGSACASGSLEPSRILLQMGLSRSLARSALRFSLCRTTTREEVDAAVDATLALLQRLRS